MLQTLEMALPESLRRKRARLAQLQAEAEREALRIELERLRKQFEERSAT